MEKIQQVLIIEDNPADLLLLQEYLESGPMGSPGIRSVDRLEQLKTLPAGYHPDIIFLDLLLPDSHGLETLLRVVEVMPGIPVIVLSGLQNSDLALQALSAGAQDYLIKGEFDEQTLFKTIHYSIERKKSQVKLQESEARYRALVDNAPEALVVLEADTGKFVNVSESAVQLFKMSREQLLQIGPIEVSPEFQPGGKTSAEAAMSFIGNAIEGKNLMFEWTHQDAQGRLIPCEVRLVQLPSPSDRILVRGSITDISERKKAEEALRSEEETRKLIMNSALDAIICMDLEGAITVWTLQAEKIFGWKESEILGKTVAETIIPPEFREQHRKGLQRYLKTGEGPVLNRLIEITAIDRSGREFPIELTIAPIHQGEYRFFCAFIRDITDRKKAEENIRKSQQSYEALVNNIDGIVWEADAVTFLFSFVSRQAERLLGYPVEKWLNEPDFWKNHIYEDDRSRAVDFCVQQTALKRPHEFEYRMVASDGKLIWLRDIVTIELENDQPARLRGIMVDITASKEAEAEIMKMHDRLKHISQATNDAIWDHDLLTGEVWWNDKLYELYGIAPGQPPAGFEEWKERIHPDDRERVLNKLRVTQEEQQSYWQDEYRFRLPDGSYANMFDRNYYIYKGNKLVRKSGSNLDITQLKKAEETLINSELRFRTLTSNAPVGIFQTDTEGKTIYVNETWLEFTGLSFDEAMGYGWMKALHPDEKEKLVAGWKERSLQGVGSATDFRFIDKKGNSRWVSGNAAPLYNKNGEYAGHIGTLSDITERKKSETELLKMNERLQLVSHAANDAVWDHDLQTGEIWWNEKQHEFFGSDPKGPPQDHEAWVQRIHPDDRERVIRGFEEKQNGKEPYWSDEYRFRLPDGQYAYLYDRSFFSYINDQLVRISGSTVDITALKKAEAALVESEEKYRTLVDQAGDAIFIFEESGQFIDVNDVSCELLGYTKEELKRLTLYQINFPEELEKNPVRMDLLKHGESVIRRRRFRRKDGSGVEVEVNSKRLPDGRFLGMVRDLTERIKAQQQIEKEKKLADNIIESLPGLFYLLDQEGHYIRWNKLKETISEYSGEEISRMSPLDFFEGEDKERVRLHIIEAFQKGETRLEAQLVTKSGQKKYFYFTGISVEYEGRICLLGTGIDISDRKKAEDLLRQSSEQLRQLSAHLQHIREEERINIAREIHDELGQQLTVLKMDISWLKKKIVTSDEKVEYKMNDLMKMIDNTVKTVRKISSDLRPSMLDDLGLVAALEWHSGEFEKRSGVKTEFHSEVPEIKLPSDTATGMFRIFQESLTNVARHANASQVKALLKLENGRLCLRIRDNGRGFSVNSIENKNTLGILGMRERVLIMNGEYRIDSMPGEGTLVEVIIPFNSFDNN